MAADMLEYGRGLFARIVEALGIDQRYEPPPAYAVVALERVSEGEELREEAVALFEELSQPMAMLNSACQDAGVLPATQHKAPERLEIYRDAVVAVLKADRKAAMTVSSLIIQYQEALAELKKLDAALESGEVHGLNLEKAKGKFFYLTRVRFALQPWPMLLQLFGGAPALGSLAAVAATPRQGTGGSGRSPAPRPPGTAHLGGAGNRDTANLTASAQGAKGQGSRNVSTSSLSVGVPSAGGVKKSKTGALTPPAASASFETLVEEGLRLVQNLQMKILILQAAAEKAQGKEPQTEGLLPPPARQTADSMAGALAQDRHALKLVQTAVQRYRDVCMMLHRGDPAEHQKLRQGLMDLGTIPLQLGDNAVLAKLFPAA